MPESERIPVIRRYRRPAHILWVVEQKDILLLNQHTGDVLHLGYPEAALWDLLQKEYPMDRTIRMLSIISARDDLETRQLINQTLEAWTRAGFLVSMAENGESFHHR